MHKKQKKNTVGLLYNDHLYNGNFDFQQNFFGNRSLLIKIYCIITEFTLSDIDDNYRRQIYFFNTIYVY